MKSATGQHDDVDAVLAAVRDRLGALPGITGLALGGSRARGTAKPDSDIDVGVYYDDAERPDMNAILAAAAELDDEGKPIGHGGYGEWGPWINGGVWLKVGGFKTDLLLRDRGRVERVVREAARGRFTVDYQPGHPHGFVSLIYAGEVFHNRPLLDADGRLAELRGLVDPYPPSLAVAVEGRFGWESGFSLDNADSPARRGDIVQTTGLLYRAVACMNQVVYARNGRFMLNEKGALAEIAGFPRVPAGYARRVTAALGRIDADPDALSAAVTQLRAVQADLSGEPEN